MTINQRTIKIAFATVISILIAQFFQLEYTVSSRDHRDPQRAGHQKILRLDGTPADCSTVLALTIATILFHLFGFHIVRVRHLSAVLRTVGLPLQCAIRHRAVFRAGDASVAGKADSFTWLLNELALMMIGAGDGYSVQSLHAFQSEPNHLPARTSGDANEGSTA